MYTVSSAVMSANLSIYFNNSVMFVTDPDPFGIRMIPT